MKAFAIVSKKSGNIIKYEEICDILCIFPNRSSAEACFRKYDDGEIKRKWWQGKAESKWYIKEVDINL